MTESETELKAELLAELQAELQSSKDPQPENQANDAADKGLGTDTSSQTSEPGENNGTPNDEGPKEESEAVTANDVPTQVDEPENHELTSINPERKQVVIAIPEAAKDTANSSKTSPRKSLVQTPQSKSAESPGSTLPIVASVKSHSTTSSSSESDHEPKDADEPQGKEDHAAMPESANSVESPKSSRMGSLFSPVISKLRMDSIVIPTSNKSRRSTISSSPSTLRKTSQALSDLLPLSASSSRPKEEERLSIAANQTPIVQTPMAKVIELVRVPSSTTVIDFVPDITKEPENQQRLSVATIGQDSVKNEPQSRVPSISSQTLAPSVKVEDLTLETSKEPVILKKTNTDQTSKHPTSIASEPVMDVVKSLRNPRKRDKLRNRACPEWLLILLFGHTVGKRMKAMLELAAGQ